MRVEVIDEHFINIHALQETNLPGLSVWVYPTPTRLLLFTLAYRKKKHNSQFVTINSHVSFASSTRLRKALQHYLHWWRHPCPAGIWLQSQSVCCCCQRSRPGWLPSPACRSPSGRWSPQTQLHHCFKDHKQRRDLMLQNFLPLAYRNIFT